MADVVDKETRSRMMSGIRGKDTKPEMIVRQYLHRHGFRYRLHDRKLPGHPDIVLPKYHAVIFVHGCFWHGHACRFFKIPKTRTNFWTDKISANRQRDAINQSALAQAGWRVLVVWECSLREANTEAKKENLLATVKKWVGGGPQTMQISGGQ